MKRHRFVVLIVAFCLAIPLAASAKEGKKTPSAFVGVNIVNADTVKKWLDSGEELFILDARKKADFDAGHLPDAELCTVPSDLNVTPGAIAKSVDVLKTYGSIKELEKDAKIIAYCNSET